MRLCEDKLFLDDFDLRVDSNNSVEELLNLFPMTLELAILLVKFVDDPD